MLIRRIVTGHSASGKSVVIADAPATRTARFEHVPGFVASLLWETRPAVAVPADGADAALAAHAWTPQPDGTNVMIVTFPPDSVMAAPGFVPAAAGAEYMEKLPGLAEHFEPDHPGMHTTDTVDYGVLLEGEIHLELDDGEVRKLAPRDVVIQNGTRHAWRNRSGEPATMLFVLVGARRRQP